MLVVACQVRQREFAPRQDPNQDIRDTLIAVQNGRDTEKINVLMGGVWAGAGVWKSSRGTLERRESNMGMLSVLCIHRTQCLYSQNQVKAVDLQIPVRGLIWRPLKPHTVLSRHEQ